VEKGVNWAHIDIAGPAESKSDKGNSIHNKNKKSIFV